MPHEEDVEAYNEAHASLIKLQNIGPIVDAARTCISRLRVILADDHGMEYLPTDPLYVQANKVDAELSDLLDLMMKEGIDCAPARS